MAYERKLDLMDESIFPIRPVYTQEKNPPRAFVQQTEKEIIESVSKEMSGMMTFPKIC
jgi:hypothetical protein